MPSILKKIFAWTLAIATLFIVINEITSYSVKEIDLTNSKSLAEETLEKINNPKVEDGKLKSQASVDTALDMAKNQLSNASSESEKLSKAVNMFRGFYVINARSRPKFCSNYGVNINTFVEMFEKEHVKEYAFMKQYEVNYQKLPAKFYEMFYEMSDKQVSTEMINSAKDNNLSLFDYCKTFSEYPSEYIEQIKISKRMPEIHLLLSK